MKPRSYLIKRLRIKIDKRCKYLDLLLGAVDIERFGQVGLVAHELGADGDKVGRRHDRQVGERQDFQQHSCKQKDC